ncbi:uncharacterized protein LOC142766886 [Rhipicephalus microplus]|uniref:uncharacterized protein LOC142766886 n=1 Tax=Rhipicephalus microplus TaxID=6941 RepID=UPI003F6A83F0
MTAVNASDVTVHLRMNEALSDLVQRLNAENLYAVRELVIRNRGNFETPELYAQIGRCARLRRLSCVSCAFKPSTLLKLVLEQLRYLQKLELSLVQDFKAVVDSEIGKVRLIALQMCDIIRYHSLRRLYVEVGDDRNFELLLELLVCCPNLTELHVHCVRGTFMECLLKCQQLHEHLGQLETFTFTSEVPDSVPIFDSPNPIFRFQNYAAVCGNVCHDKPHHWWSCVELDRLARSGPSHILPSQLVVFACGDLKSDASLLDASIRHNWTRVRKLCLLLLPQWSTSATYPRATLLSKNHLGGFFFALENVVELNASVSVMPNLQHLCLLTSLWVSEADVSKCIRDYIAHSAQLNCVHVHYRRHNGWLQQRLTGLHRPQGQVLFQGGPCFACCSTETFIGLVKPLNRDCEASMQTN